MGQWTVDNTKDFEEIKKGIEGLKLQQEDALRVLKVWLSYVLEQEMITQDKFDELMNLLREFGRKKGWL